MVVGGAIAVKDVTILNLPDFGSVLAVVRLGFWMVFGCKEFSHTQKLQPPKPKTDSKPKSLKRETTRNPNLSILKTGPKCKS